MIFNDATKQEIYTYMGCMMSVRREIDASELECGACRFANLNRELGLQTSQECIHTVKKMTLKRNDRN